MVSIFTVWIVKNNFINSNINSSKNCFLQQEHVMNFLLKLQLVHFYPYLFK